MDEMTDASMTRVRFIFEKKLPPYTLAVLDLTAHELQSPRWQAETIPLDHAAVSTRVRF
jgi:hypothetical protein